MHRPLQALHVMPESRWNMTAPETAAFGTTAQASEAAHVVDACGVKLRTTY
jgi:hypothetical protein